MHTPLFARRESPRQDTQPGQVAAGKAPTRAPAVCRAGMERGAGRACGHTMPPGARAGSCPSSWDPTMGPSSSHNPQPWQPLHTRVPPATHLPEQQHGGRAGETPAPHWGAPDSEPSASLSLPCPTGGTHNSSPMLRARGSATALLWGQVRAPLWWGCHPLATPALVPPGNRRLCGWRMGCWRCPQVLAGHQGRAHLLGGALRPPSRRGCRPWPAASPHPRPHCLCRGRRARSSAAAVGQAVGEKGAVGWGSPAAPAGSAPAPVPCRQGHLQGQG